MWQKVAKFKGAEYFRKALYKIDFLLHCSPVDENGGVLGPLFPEVHNHHVEGDVFFLAPHGQVSDLLPIECLVVVGDQANFCCVIGKCYDGVGVVSGQAVMREQGACTPEGPLC